MHATTSTQATRDQLAQIEQLRDEANTAGDHLMARVCDEAIEGDAEAFQACLEVINDCAAMHDDTSEHADDLEWDWAQARD
tara:strand:+ start:890 stop:1132 length:243 start_codon:yes stop_codon:yes gene_type:complete